MYIVSEIDCCLTPPQQFFSYIMANFQFYWWRKPEDPDKTIDLSQVTDKLYHIKLYTSHEWDSNSQL